MGHEPTVQEQFDLSGRTVALAISDQILAVTVAAGLQELGATVATCPVEALHAALFSRDWLNEVHDQHGRVDGLVLSFLTEPTTGALALMQRAGELMAAQKSGSIVTVASLEAVVGDFVQEFPGPDWGPKAQYTLLQGGVVSLSRQLATQFARGGVRVNSVTVGWLEGTPEAATAAARAPLKRSATPTDIMSAAAFLISDAASYVTGLNLMVDGGYTAW